LISKSSSPDSIETGLLSSPAWRRNHQPREEPHPYGWMLRSGELQ
jgi:hypothetical protein